MRTTHRFLIDDDYITHAQRLTIAQNKTLRLLYQTWWVHWLPRIVFALGAIVFAFIENFRYMALLFGLFLILSFAGEMFTRRNLAKARGRLRSKGSTSIFTMDDQGLDASGFYGTSHLKWEAMLQPTVYPDGVLIKLSRVSMIWLPDSALIEGTQADVRQLLAANIKVISSNRPAPDP
jgi:hypothetical protein